MDHVGYNAEAFYPEPGQGFRMVMAGADCGPADAPKSAFRKTDPAKPIL